jgi:hypothetical protein
MSVIATEAMRIGNLIKVYDAPNNPELFNDVVTVNEASPVTYTIGTVLGKITSSGKYIICKQAAADGSQVPAAIYIGNSVGQADSLAIAATTDTSVLALTRGKVEVSAYALALDSSFNTGTLVAGAYASLKAAGIIPVTAC